MSFDHCGARLVLTMWLIRKCMDLTFLVLLLDPALNLEVQFCGFEQKCAENGTYGEQPNDSCCQPCECANVCKERDTCCADKEGRDDNEETIKQQCLPAIYMPEGRQPSSNIQSFYTRARCPKAFNDLRIKEKCENEMSIESLEDITYVSSEDGTIVYKNKFCGLCHDEKETIPWKLSVSNDCVDMLRRKVTTLTTFTQTLLAHCSIQFKEPEILVFKHTVCFDRAFIISQCNNTGNWDVYDSKLEELCRRPSESVHYYKMTPTSIAVYRNVFCYLCNTEANTGPQTCEQLDIKFSVSDPVSNLIRQDLLASSAAQNRISNGCKADQIFDTFFKVCRRLYCPLFLLPSNGRCIPFLDTKMHFPLIVRLVPLEYVNKTESIKKELKSRYVSVLRKLGLGQCEMCYTSIYLKRSINESSLSDVHMRFALAVTEKCKIDHMMSKLTSIEMTSSNIKLTLNKTLVRFDVFWEYIGSWNVDPLGKILSYNSVSGCRTLYLGPASNCAKVKLTTEEHYTVLKRHVHASELLFALNHEDGNGTVYVCSDKYIVNQPSVAQDKRFDVSMALLTSIIFYFRQEF